MVTLVSASFLSSHPTSFSPKCDAPLILPNPNSHLIATADPDHHHHHHHHHRPSSLTVPTTGLHEFKLASQSSSFQMPESGELSILSPAQLHHHASPKINSASWNTRRHLKLNLNLNHQCLQQHHHHNHSHGHNHASGVVPYGNVVNLSNNRGGGVISPPHHRMSRQDESSTLTSKKSKLDFCPLPLPPESTPASSLPGNPNHIRHNNDLHHSQLHLPLPSFSGRSVHPTNYVCYLQQQTSPLTSPNAPYPPPPSSSSLSSSSFCASGSATTTTINTSTNNTFSCSSNNSTNNNNNSSSPSANRRRGHPATSPTSALVNSAKLQSPLSSPASPNCGCGLVCSAIGASSSSPSASLQYSSSSSSRAELKPISDLELSKIISQSRPMLLIDVRSPKSYHRSHIQGAVNLSCVDRFVKRRIQMGRASVLDLLGVTSDTGSTSSSSSNKKRAWGQLDIVVYDDHSSFQDLCEPNQDSTLCTVLSSLLRDGKNAFILEGGLKRFSLEHEQLCGPTARPPHPHTLPPRAVLYSPTNGLHEPEIEAATASQVLPFLYLGNERDAKDLSGLRNSDISYVLNVTSHVPQFHEGEGIRYKRIPASDSAEQDLRQYFEEAIEFIDDARQNNARVLIHCHAGVSRSATITIAYLLKHTRMAMADAYKFVKGKRAIISPNFNFMGQLLEFEHDLNVGMTPRILQPRLSGMESSV